MRKTMLFVLLAALVGALVGTTAALANHKPGHPAKPGKSQGKGKGKSKAKQNQGDKKVTICHRTKSAENPTVEIRVSKKAVAAHERHGDTGLDGSGCGQNNVPRGFQRLTADLTAVQGATGSGSVTVDIRGNRVCYTLNVSGVTATAAHIHVASTTTIGGQEFQAGAIVVPLATPGNDGTSRGCVKVSRAIAQAILANPSNFFVNVHSSAFPNGQVQGTLAKAT